MAQQPKIGQAQRAVIAGLLCIVFAIAVSENLSSYQTPPSTKNIRSQETSNEQTYNKKSINSGMAADDWLALFTLALVFVGGFQVRLFWVQLRLIGESLVDAKKAADAAEGAAPQQINRLKFLRNRLPNWNAHTSLCSAFTAFGETSQDNTSSNIPSPITVKFPRSLKPLISGLSWTTARGLQFRFYGGKPRAYDSSNYGAGRNSDISRIFGDRLSDGGVVVENPESGSGQVVPDLNLVREGFQTFFRGLIHYRGPFTRDHETSATWWYFDGRHEFVLRGGEEYNYVK